MVKLKKLNIEDLKKFAKERKNAGLDKYLAQLDHIAYRVEYGDMHEVMEQIIKKTPYDFLKYYDVSDQNARTAVLRFKNFDPAIVVSEGLEHVACQCDYSNYTRLSKYESSHVLVHVVS